MSFLGTFHIDGVEYNIVKYSTKFVQPLDDANKAIGEVYGGVIKLVIESRDDADILAWMLNSNLTKDARIVFYRRDAMSKSKEMILKNTFCSYWEEFFIDTTETPMQVEFNLVVEELTYDKASFSNKTVVKKAAEAMR